jgi:hypothetical protein
MTRTLIGLYDDYDNAASAVRDLEAAGISQDDISVIANDSGGEYANRQMKTAGTKAGAGAEGGATYGLVVGGAAGLMAGLGMLAIPGVGPVVAAGWLAAASVGALGGAVIGGAAGGLIGSMVENGIPEEHAHIYAEGVRRGGTLVTVRVSDSDATRAGAILQEYRLIDPVALGQSYRDTGWDGFDVNAPPYSVSEAERERLRRSA